MVYPADTCTNANNEYERAQRKAAASQSNPQDPWRDSKGNITDFGAPIYKASGVSSEDLIDVQRRVMGLLGTVNELLARMGGR